MKTCVLSESAADEAAIRILLGALHGKPVEPVSARSVVARGWTSVFAVLPAVVLELHFHTDAEALVAVVDSDTSPVHDRAHDEPGKADPECRLCALLGKVARTRARLKPRPGQPALKIAVGLAIPAIEAWYLCSRERMVSEAEWIRGLQEGKPPYTKNQLKQLVYGTDRPSLELETECATREAQRLAQDLSKLEAFFPNGFGALARQVRAW